MSGATTEVMSAFDINDALGERILYAQTLLELLDNLACGEIPCSEGDVNHPGHEVQKGYALRRALQAEIDGIAELGVNLMALHQAARP